MQDHSRHVSETQGAASGIAQHLRAFDAQWPNFDRERPVLMPHREAPVPLAARPRRQGQPMSDAAGLAADQQNVAAAHDDASAER